MTDLLDFRQPFTKMHKRRKALLHEAISSPARS
jgi:hypothetical protein